MRSHRYFVYILTNARHTVLYTGVTRDLHGRTQQHKQKQTPGFTSRYNVNKLVYFEQFDEVNEAIAREKHIKAGPRQRKVDLINSLNPEWKDLAEEVWRI